MYKNKSKKKNVLILLWYEVKLEFHWNQIFLIPDRVWRHFTARNQLLGREWWSCHTSISSAAWEGMLQAAELTRPLYSSSSPQSIHFSTSSLLCSSLRLYLTVTRACRRWRLWPGDWGPLHTLFTRRPTRWAAIRAITLRLLTWEEKKKSQAVYGSDRPLDPPQKIHPNQFKKIFSNQDFRSIEPFLSSSEITKMKKYINVTVRVCFLLKHYKNVKILIQI